MSKRRLSDGSIVELTPQEEAQRAQEHAAQVAQAEATQKALAARERILDALAADETPDPQDRADFRNNRDKLPPRAVKERS